jgi:hypothetical protein
MSKPTQQINPQPNKKTSREILSSVPYENGFHFYITIGKYTGITANSLSEFSEKLKTIPVESVLFHFQRDDYQKWIRNTIGDEELAARIDQLKKWPSWSSDENLRKELVKATQIRITELKPDR